MKHFVLAAGFCTFFVAHPAFADVSIGITFDAPPPVIEVSPGIEVVQDYDGDDIYYSDGFYWVSRDGGWYRTRDYRGGWVVVEGESVPGFIRETPRGHFHHWNASAQHNDTHFQAEHHGGGREPARSSAPEARSPPARSSPARAQAPARAPAAAKRSPEVRRAPEPAKRAEPARAPEEKRSAPASHGNESKRPR